jgi:hypothetical protein
MDCSISAAGPVDTDPGLLNDERWAKSAEILLQRGGSNKGELQGDSAPECAQSGVQLYSLIDHCDTNPRATGDALRCAPHTSTARRCWMRSRPIIRAGSARRR